MEPIELNLENQLTPRQLQIFKRIAEFQLTHSYSPTIGELAEELGISRSTAFEHIGELRKKGQLTASPGRARSLMLTPKAQELLERLKSKRGHATVQRATAHPDPAEFPAESIAVLGKVAAGVPIEAIENKEHFSLASVFGETEKLFALEVRGESMVEEDIHDGDYVICRKSHTAENGQLVIAKVEDNEVTIKKFYREKAQARLQPANANYQPIFTDKCQIQAVVVGLLRNL